jgi:hypothetical protein
MSVVLYYINPDDGGVTVSEALEYTAILTWLIVREEFIAFCHRECFKSCGLECCCGFAAGYQLLQMMLFT